MWCPIFVGCGPLCESDGNPHRPANFYWKKQIQLPVCAVHCSRLCSSCWASFNDPSRSSLAYPGTSYMEASIFKVLCFGLSRRQHMRYGVHDQSICYYLRMVIIHLTRYSGELDLMLLQLLSHIFSAKDIVFSMFTDRKPLRINHKQVETTKNGHVTYSLIYARLTVRCTGTEYVGHQRITWFLNQECTLRLCPYLILVIRTRVRPTSCTSDSALLLVQFVGYIADSVYAHTCCGVIPNTKYI